MTHSSPFSPADARLDLAGAVLSAGRLRLPEDELAPLAAAMPASHWLTHALGATTVARSGGQVSADDTQLVVCHGEPYWLANGQAADAAGIAARYRACGAELLGELGGPFTLTLIDRGGEQVLCAVDRFAREPLYWTGDAEGLVAGATADAVLAHPLVPRELSEQGLFDYLFFHMVPAPDTVYRGVYKLPAAHCLVWRPGAVEVRPYWLPSFDESDKDPEALRAGVLDSLRTAVARADGGVETGSFLSGGLDSSTVSGLLAEGRAGADAYSIGFDAEDYDEIAYARIAARRFGLQGHEYYVRPDDVLAALPSVAAAYDEPFGNSSALPALFCAAFARADGRTRLLAGDGGDELYAGNARYAKQQVFEAYWQLPAAVRNLLGPMALRLPARAPGLGKVRSYVEQASVRLPDRLQSYNYICRLGAAQMFEADFLAAVDPERPLALSREIYHRPPDASTLNRMLYLDWQHTLADNDLRKVGRMCALAGVEVRYPMLDEAVVNHANTIPSRLKLPGAKLRDFYKQATRGFLPDQIIDKPKHGFGLPFGVWLADHAGLRELAGDTLSRLRGRGILQPAFIDKAQALHRQEHARYYGELVWVMVMLELWLDSHGLAS